MTEPKSSQSDNGTGSRTGITGLAKHVATQVVEHTRDLVGERVSQRAGKSVSDLNSLADALRLTGKQLEGNMASPLIDKAADQVQRVGALLEAANGREALQAVERFARTEPTLFVGGAIALGLIGARFLKSSAKNLAAAVAESESLAQSRPANGQKPRRNHPNGRRDTRAQS
jgi:hypothetical protein